MSYLQMSKSFPITKVVISFWFRVPTESADEVRSRTANVFWDYRVFFGVVPLITWGTQQTVTVPRIETYDSGSLNVSGGIIFLSRLDENSKAPMQPSGIGVRVGSAKSPDNPPTLDVHIQTDVAATGSGFGSIASSFTGDFIGIVSDPGPNFGKPVYSNVQYITEDVSSTILGAAPDYFGNSDSHVSSSGAGYPEVKLDKWHHLLISWDLKSGTSKMWCAIDDKNIDGTDLPAMNNMSLMGPNDHMPWATFQALGSDTMSASLALGDDNVPTDPVNLPAPSSVKSPNNDADSPGFIISIAPIEKVELAELQIFSGVTLDASNVENRRAFITKDEKRVADGNVPSNTYKPANPSKAKELMGKEPDIMLHGSGNWKNGNNTGALGFTTDQDGNKKKDPSGQFKASGEIKKYKPDPSIEL